MRVENLSLTEMTFDTPILFLIFNRIETTKQVFQRIREVKPKSFYLAADGPRADRIGETEIVNSVRRYVIEHVDWDCEVKTLFRENNLGCRQAVFQAIKWFFQNEEEGIILEDDCLPTGSFFRFCETLLKRYRNDDRIIMISGRNHIGMTQQNGAKNYFFANTGHIWGWATWRRAIHDFTLDLPSKDIVFIRKLRRSARSMTEFERALRILSILESGKVNSWAYVWDIHQVLEKKYAIFPCKNMIKNIGRGPEATHTKSINYIEDTNPVFDVHSNFPAEEIYDKNFSRRIIESYSGGRIKLLRERLRRLAKKILLPIKKNLIS